MNPTMPVLLWPPCGGNILDKYEVRLMNQALQDLDEIYGYIASNLQEPGVAAEFPSRDTWLAHRLRGRQACLAPYYPCRKTVAGTDTTMPSTILGF